MPRYKAFRKMGTRAVCQFSQCFQTGSGEVGIPLTVIYVTVNGTGTAGKIVQVIHKVDLHAILPVLQPVNACVLLPPAQGGVELVEQLYLVGRIFLDLLVVRKDENDFVSVDPCQSGRESFHDIAQSTGLDIGRAFGGEDRYFHTVSPLLMITGALGVPISLEPGRTVTSLSRITHLSSQFSPTTVSFIMTLSSTTVPAPMET